MDNFRNFKKSLVLPAIAAGMLLSGLSAGEKKLGQTGFQFLSVGSDAQAGAMANAVTSVYMKSSSLFFNPAALSRMENTVDVSLSQNSWIADIKHNAVSASFKPFNGKYGVFGVSFLAVDYGEVQGTVVWQNDAGYIKTEKLHPSAIAFGVGYARSLTDKFSVGGHVKYTSQQLGKSMIPDGDNFSIKKNLASAYAFDFGTLYRTGMKSLVFGMSVRNFSNEIEFEKESFQLPLQFSMGLSMNLLDFVSMQNQYNSLLFSIDAIHPRSYPEQLKFGLEYRMLNLFAFRAGYHLVSDEQKLAFGFGMDKFGLKLDYAYTPFGSVFDSIQRISISFSI